MALAVCVSQVTVLPLAADIIATLPGVGPVLQLDILLRQDGQLALWPGKQEWAEQLDTTQRSTAVLARGAPRLVLAPELQQYLELPTEGLHLDMEGLLPIILGEAHTKATEAIFAAVTQALAAAEAFMHGLDHLQQMVARNNSVTRELLEQQVAAGVKGLPELRADLQNFHAQLDSVKGMPAHRWVQQPGLVATASCRIGHQQMTVCNSLHRCCSALTSMCRHVAPRSVVYQTASAIPWRQHSINTSSHAPTRVIW